jgi:hypothetical protein
VVEVIDRTEEDIPIVEVSPSGEIVDGVSHLPVRKVGVNRFNRKRCNG